MPMKGFIVRWDGSSVETSQSCQSVIHTRTHHYQHLLARPSSPSTSQKRRYFSPRASQKDYSTPLSKSMLSHIPFLGPKKLQQGYAWIVCRSTVPSWVAGHDNVVFLSIRTSGRVKEARKGLREAVLVYVMWEMRRFSGMIYARV